jgi:PP-loop superfamily ATP-utilizing enzyme
VDIFSETARQLQKQAETHEGVLVAYSGGKDSLAVTSLCCRAFPFIRTVVHRREWFGIGA